MATTKTTKAKAAKATKAKVDPRVEVARDVIALLKAKRVIATSMAYFEVKLKRPMKFGTDEVDIQKLMAGRNVAKCEVCAKGAMLVAFAMKHDKAKASIFGLYADAGNSDCLEALSGTFSRSQLDDIEAAYEGFRNGVLWLRAYSNDEDRLRAIMRRIVKNGGEFSANEVP